ncbi:MAG TPA: CpXC domain-containing protein [Acetobacteraceae bacterium]
MSIFLTVTASCAKCGAETEVDLAASVNADRRPDLREEILDGRFQATKCRECAELLRLPAHLTYIDIRRQQWILVQSTDEIEQWRTHETDARAIFEQNFGAGVPKFLREMSEGITPRLVFGWPALREKLVAADLALDDAILEMLKISIMRDVRGAPIADEAELRLISGEADRLRFCWLDSRTEQFLVNLEVPRGAYDDIVREAEGWASLRADFTGKLFVDVKRLLVGAD